MCCRPRSHASAEAAMLQSGARAGHLSQPCGLTKREKVRKPAIIPFLWDNLPDHPVPWYACQIVISVHISA